MLKNLLIVVAIIIVTAGVTIALDQSGKPKPQIIEIPGEPQSLGERVPDFSFTDMNGESHSIQDFHGRVVILNFWASWCTPCVKEFPLLLEVAEQHSDRVSLIALSSDFEEKDMRRFIAEKNPAALDLANVVIALDENAAITADLFQTIRLPETIIIDAQGNMREKLVGANWGREEMDIILDRF